jgi:hypothetical protein
MIPYNTRYYICWPRGLRSARCLNLGQIHKAVIRRVPRPTNAIESVLRKYILAERCGTAMWG